MKKQEQESAAVWVATNALHAWDQNPRKNDGEPVRKVMESIKRFGFASPIIARTNGEIIAGHTRWKAAQALGLDRVPVRYMDLDPAEAHLLALADNKLNEEAEWDAAAVASILSDFSFEDAALAGWDSDDLDKLADELDANAPREVEEDEAPEPPAVAVTKPGDLWLLGEHRLLCGDSTKPEDVARLMQGEQADLIWTDPPYGIAYVGKTKDALTIENDALNPVKLRAFLSAALENAFNYSKPGAVWYVTATPGTPLAEFAHVLGREKLGIWKHTLVWVKDRFTLGFADYHYRFEFIFYGWKPGATHYFIDDRTQDNVWQFERPRRSAEHPTMKPIELVARAIHNSSREGGKILDLFLGSGTTLIAAEQTQRKCYGMEIDPHYCDVIVKRWETLTGKKAELAS